MTISCSTAGESQCVIELRVVHRSDVLVGACLQREIGASMSSARWVGPMTPLRSPGWP